jgi:hypothetical protein
MTSTLPDADIRGYYTALRINLPDWARTEASVRCFADPGAHRRDDRDPSCSVNLEHGAWHCHGCGAKGGAFDAATAQGYSAREAIDLMVAYRLTEHRALRNAASSRRARRRQTRRPRPRWPTPVLKDTEDDIAAWQAALAADLAVIERLANERCWRYRTMHSLGIGIDHGRITIPTRDASGQLIGLLRYQPWRRPGEPKITAACGSRRTLLPHPAAEPSRTILLLEGEPDMIAARSHGLAAIAVPGVDGWRSEWAQLLSRQEVTIATHADRQGRALAAQIAEDLSNAAHTTVVDLAPDRKDGYDLTDLLLEHGMSGLLARIGRRITNLRIEP